MGNVKLERFGEKKLKDILRTIGLYTGDKTSVKFLRYNQYYVIN